MIKSKLRTRERLADTWALKAPQVFPLLGDGYEAQRLTARLRQDYRGPDSYLGRTKRGGWTSIDIPRPDREALVDARYRDWLAQRDQRALAA